MLLNASQPFLPGGVEGWRGGGGWASGRTVVVRRGDVGWGGWGGGVRQEGWWKRAAGTGRGGDKTCGVVDRLILSLSIVCLALNSVCVSVCVCVEGYSGGHSPDHQISLHSDIPALPQPQNTTLGSMNVCVCARVRVSVFDTAKYSHHMCAHETVTIRLCVRAWNKILSAYVDACVCLCLCVCDLC